MASARQDPAADDRRQQEQLAATYKVWGRIQDRLAEMGRSMTWLAEQINYSRGELYKWKKGQVPMSTDVLNAINQALQLPYAELPRMAGKPAPVLAGAVSSLTIAILNAVDLDQHEKEKMLREYEWLLANKRRDE